MDSIDKQIEKLKIQMSEEQRKNIADVIGAELERRQREGVSIADVENTEFGNTEFGHAEFGEFPSSDTNTDSLKDIYAAVGRRGLNVFQKMKIAAGHNRDTHRSKTEAIGESAPSIWTSISAVSSTNAVLIAGILLFAGLKLLNSSSTVSAREAHSPKKSELMAVMPERVAESKPALVEEVVVPVVKKEVKVEKKIESAGEQQVLLQLDSRRVELEQKKEMLDRREEEIEHQATALSERLAELRSLTAKLEQVRVENDKRQDARLEQLAAVYGSMPPKDAAPLIGKLDTDIAIPLLERLPGKKIGQILSMMRPDRAIELTQLLSKKKESR